MPLFRAAARRVNASARFAAGNVADGGAAVAGARRASLAGLPDTLSDAQRDRALVFHQRATLLYHGDEHRAVFNKCSGFHTKRLRWIVNEICTRGWWVAMPFVRA